MGFIINDGDGVWADHIWIIIIWIIMLVLTNNATIISFLSKIPKKYKFS